MMSFLFDQETVTRNYGNERYNEALELGKQQGYEMAAAENKLLREEIARLKASMGQV